MKKNIYHLERSSRRSVAFRFLKISTHQTPGWIFCVFVLQLSQHFQALSFCVRPLCACALLFFENLFYLYLFFFFFGETFSRPLWKHIFRCVTDLLKCAGGLSVCYWSIGNLGKVVSFIIWDLEFLSFLLIGTFASFLSFFFVHSLCDRHIFCLVSCFTPLLFQCLRCRVVVSVLYFSSIYVWVALVVLQHKVN